MYNSNCRLIPKLIFNNIYEMQSYLNNNILIAYWTFKAIESAIINDDLIIKAFVLINNSTNQTFVINIMRDNFDDILNKMLPKFEENECYEVCSRIRDLKEI